MGYIKLDRKIMDSWLWSVKPFSKGQAWIDLLLLANWKEVKEFYKGQLIQRRPGEVACSIEWLADRWGWDRKKVMRFLDVLEVDGMLSQKRTTQGTTLTVGNWDKYQTNGTAERTGNGTTSGQRVDNDGTATGHTIRKEKKGEESIKKAEEETRARGLPPLKHPEWA